MFILSYSSVAALEPLPPGEIRLALDKLDRVASVMYVAAHPDDENTRLISWLARERLVHTVYLSLTRGDGGQNLLGADLDERLGLLRTHELMAARAIDGGEQRFTRAIDFGFSKTAEETKRIWGMEEILADVVWAIRLEKPDLIVTRFSPEDDRTHGHHSASAQLARMAFRAAADPAQFPEQLQYVEPWQARRIVWNTSSWFYRARNQTFDPSGLLAVDVGVFQPLLGTSHAEIASASRSRHKTQGFGSTATLGRELEYFAHLDGDPATVDLLDGVDASWDRIPGGRAFSDRLQQAITGFDDRAPWKIVPLLLSARSLLAGLEDRFWVEKKLGEMDRIIAACLGLDLEAVTREAQVAPGDQIDITLNLIQRSPLQVELQETTILDVKQTKPEMLTDNRMVSLVRKVTLPSALPISQPYWLDQAHGTGHFTVEEQQMRGRPVNPPSLAALVRLRVEETDLYYTLPVEYKTNDPVDGEIKENLVLVPPLTIDLDRSSVVFPDAQPRSLTVKLQCRGESASGEVRFKVPAGWSVDPESRPFSFSRRGEEEVFAITVRAHQAAATGPLSASAMVAGKSFTRGQVTMTYRHLPKLTYFPSATAQLVRFEAVCAARRVGYLEGAGDEIPDALRHLGCTVEPLAVAGQTSADLSRYDAIVLGVRALNTVEGIDRLMPALLGYVEAGGTLLLQYNTSHQLKTDRFAPFPLTLSRERVCQEEAVVSLLAPDHPALRFPNALTTADFDDWVQERGLYFPNEWDAAYTALLSCHDDGEPPRDGGLLVARYGQGWYVYTGYSFFRQLPRGVPGAYRLMANLLSLGKSQ